MHLRSTMILVALALGVVSASAFAQSNSGAPLSPGGISAGASSFGGPGPGYIGPSGGGAGSAPYSNTAASGAPLSPGGVSAGASSFGGPGPAYIGPSGGSPSAPYPNTKPSGAPLSPGGIGSGASSYGGPGYTGN